MAREEGVERVVYLGGLGDERSEHLKSRAATAEALAEHGRRSCTSAPRW